MSAEKFTAQDVIDVINLRRGFNVAIDSLPATSFRFDCDNIDCGGNAPDHKPTCEYMRELHGDA